MSYLYIRPDLIPGDYRAEGVVELLRKQGVAGKRILYPRAELARDLIPRALRADGATVAAPLAYRTLAPEALDEDIRTQLQQKQIDAVTFTSSSTVNNLLDLLGADAVALLEGVAVVSIGPLTTETAVNRGLNVAVEPQDSTLEAMVNAMVEYFVPGS